MIIRVYFAHLMHLLAACLASMADRQHLTHSCIACTGQAFVQPITFSDGSPRMKVSQTSYKYMPNEFIHIGHHAKATEARVDSMGISPIETSLHTPTCPKEASNTTSPCSKDVDLRLALS